MEVQHRESKSTKKTLPDVTSYESFQHADTHSENSTHPLPGCTFSPTFFLHPGFRIKTEHLLSAIYLLTPLDLREHCFVLSACVVFDQVREIVRAPWSVVFDSWETVNQRFTKQDYARKFDLWSVACCPFITECRSFTSSLSLSYFFPAHMWKNRLVHLGRSGQRGVHLLIFNFYISLSVTLFTFTTCFIFSALRPLLYNRPYSSESVPKITTHYTIVPRETDPRWKGISWSMIFHNSKISFL